MTREELRNKMEDILSIAMSGGINFTQASRSIWDLFSQWIPPAEGAVQHLTDEEYQKPANQNRDHPIIGYKSVEHEQQPTAEGAEEIFQKHRNEPYGIFRAMEEFAALHAQRLAEKMVEEKLRKEYERGIEDGKIIGEHGSVSYIE